jgi:hypothetical protein
MHASSRSAGAAGAAARPTRLGRLQEAEDDHDRALRAEVCGVTLRELDADKALWREVGGAIGELARRVRDHCAASAYARARPCAELIAARLSESIDDQMDPAAWRIADAAAHLAACE